MSNPELVQYIVEQASKAGEVCAKKMFGDYCLYCDGKPVGLICDNYLSLSVWTIALLVHFGRLVAEPRTAGQVTITGPALFCVKKLAYLY